MKVYKYNCVIILSYLRWWVWCCSIRHVVTSFSIVNFATTSSSKATTTRTARRLVQQQQKKGKLRHDLSGTSQSLTVQQATIVPKEDESLLSYGERSRRYRRDVFAYGDWVKHRSGQERRIISNPNDLLQSVIVRQLSKECILLGGLATFIVLYNALVSPIGYDDLYGIHHSPPIAEYFFPTDTDTATNSQQGFHQFPILSVPSIFFTITLPALSFLLVFKTNTSYQRWDEGRKNWGAIVNNSRTIMREGAVWTHKAEHLSTSEKYKLIARLAAAVWLFPRSLTRHLLSPGEDDYDYATDCRTNLNPILAEDMIAARHKPTRATYELSCAINEIPILDWRRCAIDKAVNALCDAMGSNERIFTSPVPRFYTKHLNRFLQVWLLFVPFTLYDAFRSPMSWNSWGCIPATMLISFFLLGIEELGIQLEEPFSVLPMHKITNGIGLSAEEHLQWFENDNQNGYS